MRISHLGMFTICLFLLWSCILTYIFLSSIPYNPLSLPVAKIGNVHHLIPEGWGFFTRSVMEPESLLFRKAANNKWIKVEKNNADLENLLGASRIARQITQEEALVISKIDSSHWIKQEIMPIDVSKIKTVKIIRHDSNSYILHGEYIIILRERLPWAWSSNYGDINMPYKICKVLLE